VPPAWACSPFFHRHSHRPGRQTGGGGIGSARRKWADYQAVNTVSSALFAWCYFHKTKNQPQHQISNDRKPNIPIHEDEHPPSSFAKKHIGLVNVFKIIPQSPTHPGNAKWEQGCKKIGQRRCYAANPAGLCRPVTKYAATDADNNSQK